MPTGEFQGKKKNTILWEGLKFGASERDILAASLKDRDLVPNIKVNSSRFKCFLESRNLDGEFELSKKARSNRELAGFIQKEKDNCPPGHRISDDRCYPCPPGSYSSGQEAQCHLCPKNFFIDKEAADACWPCPEEKKTLREGADSVYFCVDSNGKRVSGEGFNVWFCAGVVLFLFLIISCLNTTPHNTKRLLQWCEAHSHWTVENVLWNDESRLTI
ncbi:ephrin_rec_like domain-containing protein [Trichonephila clavipes]|uniref:Ephrin_rec_like domain-containing protein n=1 Tax=Trichonephila clavipes TaxID=2585209 RepID=A0A8X6RVD5_TRICX|nr:ephrin_rec_like domain-containing protein [Trichonephila clavipes]